MPELSLHFAYTWINSNVIETMRVEPESIIVFEIPYMIFALELDVARQLRDALSNKITQIEAEQEISHES